MGSVIYGVSSDLSDCDIYGFCIPPKEEVFPHLRGEISGFGRQIKRFEQYQQSHIKFNDRVYDINIYNIVKFFNLCMENNPNMIDCLFVPLNCIVSSTQVGNLVRENRKIFLHKGCWHKFKGYSYAQLNKLNSKEPIGKRKETIDKYGWDTKFGYHVARLLDECEQILLFGDLDLQRSKEYLKAIRRGEVSKESLIQWFQDKEKQLEKIYHESQTIPYSPDEEKIKALLFQCLEIHYGNIDNCVKKEQIKETDIIEALEKAIEIIRNKSERNMETNS